MDDFNNIQDLLKPEHELPYDFSRVFTPPPPDVLERYKTTIIRLFQILNEDQ